MARLDSIIDLSHHQTHEIDFAKAKADGIAAVIHKATDGNHMRDEFYIIRRDAAKAEEILWGAYHFGAQGVSGSEQAKYFFKFVGNVDNDFVCLDFETYHKRHDPKTYCMSVSAAKNFISAVADKLGRMPFVYSGNTIHDVLGKKKSADFGACRLWIAGYVAEKKLKVQASWSDWTLWQYTDGKAGPWHKPVAGVGRCDRSVFKGDLADLRNMWAS